MLGWFGLDSRPNQDVESPVDGGIARTGGSTAWETMSQDFWAVVPLAMNAASGGIALVKRWYRLVLDQRR